MAKDNGYQSLVNKLNDWLDDVEKHEIADIAKGVEFLKEWANTGFEVSAEQVQRKMQWLTRDLQTFYQDYQTEVNESLYYRSMKDRLWHTLAEMTDKTQLEWRNITADFSHEGNYQAGEEIAIGELICKQCGNKHRVEYVQTIQPCTECEHKHFIRLNALP
ncbi:hypothetical protein C2869_18555 [Saccharobesus litoralis]|uniref:Zinc-ribbon containing domain-containing protein n=1 Tax=Saccharobesus litoralis TaxID=2172099 RepID=A0A2S0VVU1_9ALTE|nr:hypothetical protein [Saccharobesus litoralis]AWB68292.1 hypothetical protein C2869_18555 [Saccharobesus litoralis]